MGKYGHDFISSSSLISSSLSWRLLQSLSHLALTYQFLRYLSLEGFIKQWPSNDVSTTTTPLIGGKAGNTECQNENPSPHSSQMTRGPRFSKVPRTFRARKAIRKITTCLFCKARFFMWCKGNKTKKLMQSFVPRDAFVLKIQRELCHPKYARKVSELSTNGPQDWDWVYDVFK